MSVLAACPPALGGRVAGRLSPCRPPAIALLASALACMVG